jgi:hypothetical protein
MPYARALENPGADMRQFILLVVGIAIGAAGGVSVVNTLRQRDAYPRGLMDVMQHHYASLRADVRRGHCGESAQHLGVLRSLAGEIGTAVYGEDIPDAPFREFESRLADALSASTGSDCKMLAPQVQQIGESCDACHRQYR